MSKFSVDVTAVIDANGDGRVDFLTVDRVEWTYEKKNGRPARKIGESSSQI